MSKLDEIVDSLKELGDAGLEIVQAAVRDAANRFAPTVLDSAKNAVVEVATMLAPGTEKKEAAFERIGQDLLSKGILVGIEVAVSMIYRMIEVAYEWFCEVVIGITPGAPATGSPIGTN